MLEALEVRGFAHLACARLEFPARGFCALTGETGAGKSLLVGAMSLALGGGAAGRTRAGAERAEVTASFLPGRAARMWLEDAGMDDPGGGLVVRRVLGPGRRTRAFINGRTAAAAQLAELVGGMFSIFGQHEHLQLRRAARRRGLLDAFAGAQRESGAVHAAHVRWRRARDALREAERGAAVLLVRHNEIREMLAEVEVAGLTAPAWEENSAVLDRQGAAAELAGLWVSVSADVREAAERLAAAHRAAQRISEIDGRCADLFALLGDARAVAEESSRETGRRMQSAEEVDTAALAEAEAFVAETHRLMRRHRQVSAAALLEHLNGLRAELAALGNGGEQEARACEKAERARWARFAGRLSAKRTRAAARLAHEVCGTLRGLGMAHASFGVELIPGDGEPAAHGAEGVEFSFGARKGVAAGDLCASASGGELSRVSLALLAAAGGDGERALIFDEVDAGIGGRAAAQVGAKLAELGRRRLVLCVTHLPQVAAAAGHHWLVAAGADGNARTIEISGDERAEEIARMLAGKEVTEASRRNAREILARACAF